GQQAENLLDFDDAPAQEEPSGLAATRILPSTPAAANFLSGTSTNPLDDLVSIFGGMSASSVHAGASEGAGFDGAGIGDGALSQSGDTMSPQLGSVGSGSGFVDPVTPYTGHKPQEDLLGLF
ncbi:hypothetical protein PISMIDRAFT_17475, partial [Pisolithus microcarpus 441]